MINACIFPAPPCSYTPDTVLDEDQKRLQRVRCDVVHIPVLVGAAEENSGRSTSAGSAATATSSKQHTTNTSTAGSGSGQHPTAPTGCASTFTTGLLIHHPASPFLVIYAHPNAVDAGMMIEEMLYFSRKAQCSVLLWEYQGYGLLQDDPAILGPRHDAPVPGEEVLKDDMLAVYRYVTDELNVPPTQVILMGRSIGTGPSTWLASAAVDMGLPPPLLLFLQAPFSSIVDCVKSVMVQQRVNLSFLQPLASMVVADRFRNIDVIGDVACDVIIQHGDADEIVAYSHSQRLVEAASARGKTNVRLHTSQGYSHNNLSVNEAAMLLSATLRGMQGQWLPHGLNLRPLPYHVAQTSFFDVAMRAWQQQASTAAVDASSTLARGTWHTVADMQRAFSLVLGDGLSDGSALQTRASLVKVVLASVCAFTTRLTRLWQELGMVRKRASMVVAANVKDSTPRSATQRLASWWTGAPPPAGGGLVASGGEAPVASPSPPRTPSRVPYAVSLLNLLEELIAVSGSPLGVYELRGGTNASDGGAAAVRRRYCSAFGVSSEKGASSSTAGPFRFVTRSRSQEAAGEDAPSKQSMNIQRTVFELRWPEYLLRDVLAMVEAAPLVLNAGVGTACDPFFFLSKQHVDRLQLQVERLIGFLPDDQWAALQQLMRQELLTNVDQTPQANHNKNSLVEGGGEAGEEELLSLAEINDRTAALAAQCSDGADAKTTVLAEWDKLLCMTRNVATDDGLVRQHHSDGREVVAFDPCWPAARELHQRVLRSMRGEDSRGSSPLPPSSPDRHGRRSDKATGNKKSDEDCCIM